MLNQTFKMRFKDTLNETIDILDKHGKCAIIRPTGFGKTVLMCKIASSLKYEKVLYVYPSGAVRDQAKRMIPEDKVVWCTYTKLGTYHDDPYRLYAAIKGNFDLIIFDELHKMGAAHVKATVEKLLTLIDTSEINILGGTATPKRMDGYDVIDNFFDNCITSFYGMEDAIKDKIIKAPIYVYSVEGYKEELTPLQERLDSADINIRTKVMVDVQQSVKLLDRLTNAPHIISNTVTKNYGTKPPKYMRFMVFFTRKEILQRRKDEVTQWFKEAFPNYKVNNPLVVISDSKAEQALAQLANMPEHPGTIDLVLSVNMLNEGYHIGSLTGVVLLRPTQSPVVYTQQVGRCLSVGAAHTPIIFDFVSNISIHNIFDMHNTPQVKPQTIAEQLDRLNKINIENVTLVDNVAAVKDVINKLENRIPSTRVNTFLNLRKHNYPASSLRDALGIPIWEVYQLLDKFDSVLRPLGLQRQEADNYERGNPFYGVIAN